MAAGYKQGRGAAVGSGAHQIAGIPMEHCNVCYFSHPVICILLFVAITESEGEDGCKQQPVYSHSKGNKLHNRGKEKEELKAN